jgi:hypothetical protein
MKELDILQIIFNSIVKKLPIQCQYAVIKSIDKEKHLCDCTILENDSLLPDVQLTAVAELQDSHIIVYPKIGSTVMVAIINNNKSDAYITKVSEWDDIEIMSGDFKMILNKDAVNVKVDKSSFVLDKSGEVTINDGSKGGLIIWSKLKADIEKITDFLTTFKTSLQTPVTEPGNGAPSAFQAALASSLAPKLMPQLLDSEIINDKITHGV